MRDADQYGNPPCAFSAKDFAAELTSRGKTLAEQQSVRRKVRACGNFRGKSAESAPICRP